MWPKYYCLIIWARQELMWIEVHIYSVKLVTLQSLMYIAGNVNPFGTMPQEFWHPGKCAKPDYVIYLNCGEVCTHTSCKTTRKWENFNTGTKMIIFSNKLWLIANNSKSFGNGSKSIIRNSLDLCQRSEI